MNDDIKINSEHRFSFKDLLNLGDAMEINFIITLAGIANEMQFIFFDIDSEKEKDNLLISSILFHSRIALFRIYQALNFLDRNIKLLRSINPSVCEEYINTKKELKNREKLYFNMLSNSSKVCSKIRNTFVHYQLEDKNDEVVEFNRVAERMRNDYVSIFSYRNQRIQNDGKLIDWVYFAFADEFYLTRILTSLDPSDTLSEDDVIGKIIDFFMEVSGFIGHICRKIVLDYMKKIVNIQ